MTQEDKDLLLKDLCARLPYGVKISIDDDIQTVIGQILYNNGYVVTDKGCYSLNGVTIKPYLFPISSMTEKQKEEFNSYFASVPYYGDKEHEHVVPYYFVELLMEFFHKNHNDNNGLIPMGLAIDATGLNIY